MKISNKYIKDFSGNVSIRLVVFILFFISSISLQAQLQMPIVAQNDNAFKADGDMYGNEGTTTFGTPGQRVDYILPFEMPSIPEGKIVISAKLTIHVGDGSATNAYGHLNVFGLDKKSTSDLSFAEDFDAGELLHGGFYSTIGKNYTFDESLAYYVNNQIKNNGATQGDFLVFRLSGDATMPDWGKIYVNTSKNSDASLRPTLTFTLGDAPSNSVPKLEPIGNLTYVRGYEKTIEIKSDDKDFTTGDALTFTVSANLPSFITFEDKGHGLATLTVGRDVTGGVYKDIVITVTDKEGANATETFNIEVLVEENVKPVFNKIKDINIFKNGSATVSISAYDLDWYSDELRFSINDAPSFVEINDILDGTAQLTITNAPAIGNYFIEIEVTDGTSTSVAYAVVNVNDYNNFVIADKEDIGVYPNGEFYQGTSVESALYGPLGDGNGGIRQLSHIMPFQIPVAPEGREIESITLVLEVYKNPHGKFPFEIYGIDARKSPVVLTTDAINGALITNSDFNNSNVEIFEIKSPQLLAFVKDQITKGAVAGDYVFIRLTSTSTIEWNYVRMNSANYGMGTWPTLYIEYKKD